MFRSRDDFKPQAISRIIMVCVRAVYERPVKVCGTHVSCGVVYDPPCAQDAVLFAWVSRLSSTSREFTTTLPHFVQVSHSQYNSQQTALRCVAQSAVGTRQSAVRRGGRRPSPSPAVVVLHAALYRLQYRLRLRYCTHTLRDTVHVHGFLRYLV
jgi:hypothetical protein